MAIDTRYDNNVVLKEEAFQNLLTNIKNYPVIDIDYIPEGETDELHGDDIWDNYTNGIPCIKITYGDDRSTKGNSIFSAEQREAINKNKKKINAIQVVINELTKRKNRWVEVFEQNRALYENKEAQLERYRQQINEIEKKKASFLKAGWNLLYLNYPLDTGDPYQPVVIDVHNIENESEKRATIKAAFEQGKVYYIRSNLFLYERYTYEGNDVANMTSSYQNYNAMLDDWTDKILDNEIFYKDSTIEDRGPIVYADLGPQYFNYQNIILEENQSEYTLVPAAANYSPNLQYWVKNNDEFSLYNYNGIKHYVLVPVGTTYDSNTVYYIIDNNTQDYVIYPYGDDEELWVSMLSNEAVYVENSNYYAAINDWTNKRNNHELFLHNDLSNNVKVYNLEYIALNQARVNLVSILLTYRDKMVDEEGNSIWTDAERQVLDDFINFIYSYNKLVFYETVGIAKYYPEDLPTLLARYPNYQQVLLSIDHDTIWEDEPYIKAADFQWQEKSEADLETLYSNFANNISNIVYKIENVINTNLIYIKNQIAKLNYSIMQHQAEVDVLNEAIAQAEQAINEVASTRYDLVQPTETYNELREYYQKDPNDSNVYIRFQEDGENWINARDNHLLYVLNDRSMFGYKYVKVGYRISFDNTYYSNNEDNMGYSLAERGETTEKLEKNIENNPYFTAENQASGTFRITINGHIYEVPIKGFTAVPSNKEIYITTEHNDIYTLVGNDATFNALQTYYYSTDGEHFEEKAYTQSTWTTDKDNGYVYIKNNVEYGKINFLGDLLGSGNIVTNNGNIYASGGAIGAATYLAIGGFPVDNGTEQPKNDYNASDPHNDAHAGFWYNGSNKRLIQTYNITEDTDNVGLGTYQLVLTNGGNTYSEAGIINNNGVIEFHTGLPSDNKNTNNALADIKAGNLTLGDSNSTYKITVNGVDLIGGSSDKSKFWRGDSSWSNTLEGRLIIGPNNDATSFTSSDVPIIKLRNITSASNPKYASIDFKTYTGDQAAYGNCVSLGTHSLTPTGDGLAYGTYPINFWASKVFKAVFNDYAEYRQTIDLTPGHIVIDNDDGSLSCSSQRLQPGAQVISDTFGDAMGFTEKCQTPLAVAGRVLVYTYQPRENYHAGMAVCSAPNGTVDIMTREEIREYPDCIIGIVSEIPQYETWGTDNVKVDGRIWIKVK